MWFRVDNRLIHGQVIEGWLPYTGAGHLVVVGDLLAEDDLRQQIMVLAVPRHIDVRFVRVRELAAVLAALPDDTFVLFENCQDARSVCRDGVKIPVLNIGNIHYAPGKHQVYPHVALSDADVEDLRTLIREQLLQLDFRAVPSQVVKAPDEQLF